MNNLNSNQEFQVGKHNIGWLDSDFPKRFPNVEFKARMLGTYTTLPRYMNDAKIESELKPGLCELGDVLAFLDNAPDQCKDGNFNLFYTPSFVVGVCWHISGWGVDAWFRSEGGWSTDERVFSPATKTEALDPSLRPSEPLVLEISKLIKQVKRIADALESKPVKSKLKSKRN